MEIYLKNIYFQREKKNLSLVVLFEMKVDAIRNTVQKYWMCFFFNLKKKNVKMLLTNKRDVGQISFVEVQGGTSILLPFCMSSGLYFHNVRVPAIEYHTRKTTLTATGMISQ